jgi:hypothetical protein
MYSFKSGYFFSENKVASLWLKLTIFEEFMDAGLFV